jgi:hypothetical protein
MHIKLVLILGFIALSQSSPLGEKIQTWEQPILSKSQSEEAKNAMQNLDLFEGDIMGDKQELSKGLSQNLATYRWPNGVVPYTLNSAGYTQAQINQIISGMRYIEDVTRINGRNCITFTPRTNEANYIAIRHTTSGCYSYVGRIGGGQDLSLQSNGCIYLGTIVHEFMHALGIFHEQSRSDRDNFVIVNLNNVISGYESNFNIQSGSYQGTAYDLYSIMHYENTAFSKNGLNTITARNGITLVPAYNKNGITASDVTVIRGFYGCA